MEGGLLGARYLLFSSPPAASSWHRSVSGAWSAARRSRRSRATSCRCGTSRPVPMAGCSPRPRRTVPPAYGPQTRRGPSGSWQVRGGLKGESEVQPVGLLISCILCNAADNSASVIPWQLLCNLEPSHPCHPCCGALTPVSPMLSSNAVFHARPDRAPVGCRLGPMAPK